ncbi:hypothetical protein FHS83_002017 [Rhizomicrobium palustre]|uniref:DUF2029 domain-containing protein n=1 Tax=Rhizomicrobium palustre TaxID=189966 RepID=A0A846MZM2_9PROT|nr:glycosyltransferase family 87 protein [Rhizomicrobium palustre]NIK88699.1 hypothetical protein [Rhizomicrobium palustre]
MGPLNLARLRGLGLEARLSLVAGVLIAGFFLIYLVQSKPPLDQYGYVLGRDFVNSWMGARAVLAGNVPSLFHLQGYNQALINLFGPMPPHNWSYPPVLLLFLWPLGFFPYLAALALWSVAGYGAYIGAARAFCADKRLLGFAAVAPAAGICLFSGQNGFFTAALLILFFRFWDERPWLAGLCLGLMLYKPHLVVLFPLALVLSGRWKVFLAAGITVVALILLTALVFGHSIWSDYVRLVMPVQKGVLETGTGFLTMMPTGYMNARMLGAGPHLAQQIQMPFTLIALAAVIWTFIKKRDAVLSIAVLVTASFVVTPYAFDYDMVVFGWVIALLWPYFESRWEKVFLVVIWTLPVWIIAIGAIPVSAPLMAAFLAVLVQKTKRGGDRLSAALIL